MSVVSVGLSASRRRTLTWGLIAAALIATVATIPPLVAQWSSGGRLAMAGLSSHVSTGLEQWVLSGAAEPSTELSNTAAFWSVFHIAKAALALGLLAALIVAGRLIWSRAAESKSRLERAVWALAGVLSAWLPLLALLVVIANIQGAIAPLSSVLNFLPSTPTPAIEHIRADLASGTHSPATTVLINDFRTYHAALVATLLIVIAALLATTVVLWVHRARLPRENYRLRRVLTAGGIALPLLLPMFGLLLLANLSTVADTAPALASFFDGSGT